MLASLAENASSDTIAGVWSHINDHVVHYGSWGFAFSGHVLMTWIVGSLLVALFVGLARRMARRGGAPPESVADNLFESFILFIRDEVVIPNMGHHGHAHLHFFLTLFFFILFANLLGMVPGGQTCTGNIAVTAALAAFTFLYGLAHGIRSQGLAHFIKNIAPSGVPAFVLPILYPIELVGLLIKHGVLAIRLFANMMAGHLVIAFILVLPKLMGISSDLAQGVLSVPAFALAAGIKFLELLVAFIQAYVFTMLASIFVSAAVHPEH